MSIGSKKRILLVEDQAVVAMAESALLKRNGFSVAVVHTAKQAIRETEKNEFDLILMDIDLGHGNMDGTEAAKIILQDQDLPILFLTGHAEKYYVDKVKKITNYGYILKDSGEFVLIESINKGFHLFAAHKEIQMKEREANEVLDGIDHAVLRFNPEGIITYFNKGAERIFGFAAEEVIGRRSVETINPRVDSHGRDHDDMLIKILHNPEKYEHNENENIRKDGSRLWMIWRNKAYYDKEGNVLYMQASATDITLRKNAEQKLSKERFRLDAILAGTNAGTWEWNVQTGETVFNERWAEIIGYTLKEISPVSIQTWNDVVHPDDLEASNAALERHFNGETEYYTCEVRMRHKIGHWVWVMDRGKVADWTEGGKPVWMYGTHQEITKQKQNEERLIELNYEKDSLMKELNHRVKNNLMMVSSLINLKQSSIGDSVDLSDMAHQIDAIRIIHEKLYRSEDITHIDLREYIQQVLTTVFSFSVFPVHIENTIESIIIPTRSAVPLGLIVNETATNAMKHGYTVDAEALFSIDLKKEDTENQYVMILSNNGRPISEDTDLDNPDTLGFQLISALVSQLDGTIELQRRPHPRFTIKFPLELTGSAD